MMCLLIDPYRKTVETIDFTGGEPDPSHPGATAAQALIDSPHCDRQIMPDGDLVAFRFDDLLTPAPTGAMVDGRLTFGYALVTAGNRRWPLRSDLEALRERIQWIASTEQARAAVKEATF